MAGVDLPSRIKATIKEPHGVVNRLNTARIPLCLPPQANSTGLYTMGFSRYADIYLGFEEVWHSLIGDPADWPGEISDDPAHFSSDEARIQAVLRLLYMPELYRTRRLESDFAALKLLDPGLSSLHAGADNAGSEFRQYIKQRMPEKPHLLVAYIWIMYQAMFNGGRFIRLQLLKAGPEFWGLSPKEMNPSDFPSPLSFWCVENDETVKTEFRERAVKIDGLLTEAERQEILDESLEIFRRCTVITSQLDEQVMANATGVHATEETKQPIQV
ncbi:hypothetical protein N7492_001909 [Penicillium capsulatum]|uniref:Heme-binding peroxidase n=1 Tax=Penicillium capsulatum TaxID=69766 RepID=A0A9W9IJ51_9EURO|nr:hypothetical protein N7492_001909 [Penicillium capsulatum]KAJ6123468.1 hypothetical protein N7512_005933 [Penicillium capsulatum]